MTITSQKNYKERGKMAQYMTDETQALKTLSDTIKLFDNSEKNNCLLIDELKELEKKQMDISHQVELEEDKSDGRKLELFNRMENLRKQRRIVKDNIDFNHAIKTFSKENKVLKQKIINLIKELEAKLSFRDERVYHSKTDIVDYHTEKIR